jgi:hypothetical protein
VLALVGEVLSIIPRDPHQYSVVRRRTKSMAYSSRHVSAQAIPSAQQVARARDSKQLAQRLGFRGRSNVFLLSCGGNEMSQQIGAQPE